MKAAAAGGAPAAGGRWRHLLCAGAAPSRRAHHSAVAVGPCVVVSGGTTDRALLPAWPLFLLNLPSRTWSKLAPAVPLAAGFAGQAAAAMGPRMRPGLAVVGGGGSGEACAADGCGLLVFGGGPWASLEMNATAADHQGDVFAVEVVAP